MASQWRQVGYTYYNDPPPGAGDLKWGGYSFAELGTASRQGNLTLRGNLGLAFGLGAAFPLGSDWTLYLNGKLAHAKLEDHGYGQGGDGTYSDPRYAVDLYDGSRFGLPNLRRALGAGSSGALWIMPGIWHAPETLPPGAARLPTTALFTSQQPVEHGPDPPDHSQKVRVSGQTLGQHGSHFQGHAQAMLQLGRRSIRLRTK